MITITQDLDLILRLVRLPTILITQSCLSMTSIIMYGITGSLPERELLVLRIEYSSEMVSIQIKVEHDDGKVTIRKVERL